MSAATRPSQEGRARLARAYHATTYRVHAPGGDLDLRIGAPSATLEVLLKKSGAMCWAIVTAWNPQLHAQSLAQDAATNALAQAELERRLAQAGYRSLPGENIADDGGWSPEPTRFVFGMMAETAQEFGRSFGQNAVVVGSGAGVPKLLWCAEGTERTC
jgi:hypothetical protein